MLYRTWFTPGVAAHASFLPHCSPVLSWHSRGRDAHHMDIRSEPRVMRACDRRGGTLVTNLIRGKISGGPENIGVEHVKGDFTAAACWTSPQQPPNVGQFQREQKWRQKRGKGGGGEIPLGRSSSASSWCHRLLQPV